MIYLLKRQVVVSERDADGKLPIHLLHAAADKRWGIRDKATDLEAIWRLLLAYLNLCNMHVMPSSKLVVKNGNVFCKLGHDHSKYKWRAKGASPKIG